MKQLTLGAKSILNLVQKANIIQPKCFGLFFFYHDEKQCYIIKQQSSLLLINPFFKSQRFPLTEVSNFTTSWSNLREGLNNEKWDLPSLLLMESYFCKGPSQANQLFHIALNHTPCMACFSVYVFALKYPFLTSVDSMKHIKSRLMLVFPHSRESISSFP